MHPDFLLSAPLLFLSIMATTLMVVDALIKKSTKITFTISWVTLLVTAILSALTLSQSGTAFNGMITLGSFGAFFDILFCGAGVLTLLAARPFMQREGLEQNEFHSLLLFAISGMMLIAHANNLLTLFIGIEVMSVCFYVLAGYTRSSVRSVEASLKYFLLGAFATGFLVYGMALIYGATGSMNYNEIFAAAGQPLRFPSLMMIGIGLLIIGLSFKAAAFPFHQWAPDVYQGAPTVVTAFMSTAGKIAAFSAFLPIVAIVSPAGGTKLQLVLAVLAATTMLVGNISALVQSNIKRMLAYSSVAHAGYLMMGLVAESTMAFPETNLQHLSFNNSLNGIQYYLTAYLFMQLGAFVVVSILEKNGEKNLELSDYAGLSKRHPMLAALMSMFMLSLAGIPPFAGFFGKYYLFVATIEAGYTWLTIIAVLSSIISVYFYIGLIVKMYFTDSVEDNQPVSETGIASISLVFSSVAIVVLGLFPPGLFEKLAHVSDSIIATFKMIFGH
ncbi:MAG: NADH-quinone oxidoreductase subunit N [Ignavibacteria bacterium]|nr:NADH-quinone oxidoreductase subunit N [Ignavibacteria bacterium]